VLVEGIAIYSAPGMASDNARAIRRLRARRLYQAGYTQQQVADLLGVDRSTTRNCARDLVPRTAQQWRDRPRRTMPTIAFDDRTVTPRILHVPAPPEDPEDPRPDRLRARVAAGQDLAQAARAEGMRLRRAREILDLT
jgi:transcriptional regulator with XRE-family HTH domain